MVRPAAPAPMASKNPRRFDCMAPPFGHPMWSIVCASSRLPQRTNINQRHPSRGFAPASDAVPSKENLMKQSLLVLGVAFGMASPARAQDPVKVDSKHYTIVAENERVRVLKATYAPGEKSVMHEHPDSFAVFVTDSKARFT